MKHLWNFFTGLFFCLIFIMACGPAPNHSATFDPSQTAHVDQVSYNLYGIVQLILATFGGVATTILLTFLKSKYPKIFGTLKIPNVSDQNQNVKSG